ncbi:MULTISPECIES: hypothetical protein [Cellulomonas]|uniref:hypothetical protein n=1 Tax=Cellulomonas TaxID=1707 RepID=UPI001FE67491|nr:MULTISPECIES: hypothetical protein [Cellulomonas]
MSGWVRACAVRLQQRLRVATEQGDRGDVPGWVLITLMTAGIVSVLWVVAGNALTELFENAVRSVSPDAG